MFNDLRAQQNSAAIGYLRVEAVSAETRFPVRGAHVTVFRTGEPGRAVGEAETDDSGRTNPIPLQTPPAEYSEEPESYQPYSEYTVAVSAPGYRPFTVSGTELLPGVTALQTAPLYPLSDGSESGESVVIPPHALYYPYPPKIAEAEVKPIRDSGSIVLSRVVIPEYLVVHDGAPTDSTAKDYRVPFREYIKNVASSEIYATWPEAAITANILAILSFTLNRVYTEWYRNQGYDFTITSSTAFDHKWIYGRNIYESISLIVDEIFDSYLSRPDVKQPILTQYCDGRKVSCPGWMTQWGSADLSERGYSPIEILRYFYGSDIYTNSAEQIAGIPSSWPGEDLTLGSSGQKVQQLQEQLNSIASVYTAIPRIEADGLYGPATAEAVRAFQSIFGLPINGVTDFATWYKISHIYVGITRIAELQ